MPRLYVQDVPAIETGYIYIELCIYILTDSLPRLIHNLFHVKNTAILRQVRRVWQWFQLQLAAFHISQKET